MSHSLNLRGQGGVQGSKSDFCSFLYILLIHDIGSQELFTELKNIDFWPRTVFPKLERIARCREMYRISHIEKKGLKKSFRTRVLWVGWTDWAQTWQLSLFKWYLGFHGAFFEDFHFFPFFGTFSVQILLFFQKTPKFERKRVQKMKKNENLQKRLHGTLDTT